jgi:hypothetical protein
MSVHSLAFMTERKKISTVLYMFKIAGCAANNKFKTG